MFEFGFTKKDVVRVAYAAAFGFIGAFYVAASGLASAKNVSEAKAAVIAGCVAGIAGALSAVKNAVLKDGSTAKG